MITKTNFYIYLLLLFFLIQSLSSCYNNTTNSQARISSESKDNANLEKLQEWVENHPTVTDKSDTNDEIDGSLYRNNKYKFRIRFIDNWTFRKGDSKLTVIKSVQADSGKSISVIVEEYAGIKLQSSNLNP